MNPRRDLCAGWSADEICVKGLYEAFHVCANGSVANSVHAALDAASRGDTVGICAGMYGRSNTDSVSSISKNLTLAGTAAAATILDGGGGANGNPIVAITDVTTVELRDLCVTGANGSTPGAGGVGAIRSGHAQPGNARRHHVTCAASLYAVHCRRDVDRCLQHELGRPLPLSRRAHRRRQMGVALRLLRHWRTDLL